MRVSVIIPVYNAAAYIEKSVTSALFHNEVKEVIVVDDGSTDSSLGVLEQLQKADARVKIHNHEKNENRGRSASRNLGLRKATQPYIAFLDADDFYLENRFEADKKIFLENSEADGVYNAIGAHFYRKASNEEQQELQLTTLTEPILPEKLFHYLLNGEKGYFSIDGLTIKKQVLVEIGFFVESLIVAEDTDLLLKMTLCSKLWPGNIKEPVAIRGVHGGNIFNQNDLYRQQRTKMYESVINFTLKKKLPILKIDELLKWLFYYRNKEKYTLEEDLKYWFYLMKMQPQLLFSVLGIKYFPIIRKRKQLFPFLFR